MNRNQKKFGIGIDIGGTKIWAALGSESGEIVAECIEHTCTDRKGFLDQLNRIITSLTQDARIGVERLSGVGIGVPGTVSSTTGTIKWVPNLLHLNGINIGKYLRQQWGLSVALQNDAQLALIGEQWLGAAKGRCHVVMITIGTGIGGAIMINGQLWEGAHGIAGSIGWLTMDLKDKGHSELGWFERMASGTAINQKAHCLSQPMNSRELFEAEEKGNQEAKQLVYDIGFCVGAGIANIASVLDPEMVVIGGGVSNELATLLPSAREALKRYGSPLVREIPILPAQLGNRSGMFGALRMSFNL
jgi:glucokinase